MKDEWIEREKYGEAMMIYIHLMRFRLMLQYLKIKENITISGQRR